MAQGRRTSGRTTVAKATSGIDLDDITGGGLPHAPRRAQPRRRSRPQFWELRLYVAGATAKSKRAIENVKGLCDTYLEGRYELQVIDIYQQPLLLAGEQIVAAPTLVRKLPLPIRKLVGDMSNAARVLVGLDLHAAAAQLAE